MFQRDDRASQIQAFVDKVIVIAAELAAEQREGSRRRHGVPDESEERGGAAERVETGDPIVAKSAAEGDGAEEVEGEDVAVGSGSGAAGDSAQDGRMALRTARSGAGDEVGLVEVVRASEDAGAAPDTGSGGLEWSIELLQQVILEDNFVVKFFNLDVPSSSKT